MRPPRKLAIAAVLLVDVLLYLAFALGTYEKLLSPGVFSWPLSYKVFFAVTLGCSAVILLGIALFVATARPLFGKVVASSILAHGVFGLSSYAELLEQEARASQDLLGLALPPAILALAWVNYVFLCRTSRRVDT